MNEGKDGDGKKIIIISKSEKWNAESALWLVVALLFRSGKCSRVAIWPFKTPNGATFETFETV